MKASLFSFYTKSDDELIAIESAASGYDGVLFSSKGDKVIKVCSTSDFVSEKGQLVSTEYGEVSKVSITGMTCFRCVNAISEEIKDLPLLGFTIRLAENDGLFVCGEGVDINFVISVINGMGNKFTATLK